MEKRHPEGPRSGAGDDRGSEPEGGVPESGVPHGGVPQGRTPGPAAAGSPAAGSSAADAQSADGRSADGRDAEAPGGGEPRASGPGAQADPEAGPRYCYRHPDRETGISCVRCERPICPDCMIPASVGHQCPECVGSGGPGGGGGGARAGGAFATGRPRRPTAASLSSDPRLVTKILIGLNIAVFLAVQAFGNQLVEDLALFGRAATEPFGPPQGVAEGQWYRLLTSVFLHQAILHIAMNMLGLWFIGAPLESALGRLRYVLLYLLSGLGGSALTFLVASPAQPSLGASGAIFGLFGATAVLMRRLNYDMRPILVLVGINLAFTFTFSGIAWQAHVGGLVAGAVIAYAMVHAPRERRALVQYGACVLMLVVVAAVCAVRTLQLTG